MLWVVNSLINWWDFVVVNVDGDPLINNRANRITNVLDIAIMIFFVDIFCWFGEVAVK